MDRVRSLPHADVILVAPATYNTINKWALGVTDNYALGILAEALDSASHRSSCVS